MKAKNTFAPNPAPFEGLSTNKADYQQVEVSPYVIHTATRITSIPLVSTVSVDAGCSVCGCGGCVDGWVGADEWVWVGGWVNR